jgi:hypothetical protein
MKVDQTTYIDQIVKRFDLDDPDEYSGRNTPLPSSTTLSQLKAHMRVDGDTKLKNWADQHSYPMIIGSLIHAMVHTRPDIAFAVSVLSRSMSKPELWHYKAAQHLILYLRSTRTLGLLYSQRNMRDQHVRVTAATEVYDPFLEGAVDASFADDPETNRSTSGFVVWFGGSPVDWECKRQPLVTMSTMESEYVAASKCVLSIRFLHKFMVFMDMSRKGPTKVHEENSACIHLQRGLREFKGFFFLP